tara:strand:+ start:5980 stop:6207 length:228 start_codon:yes stop_codon:yes gene_type:complete
MMNTKTYFVTLTVVNDTDEPNNISEGGTFLRIATASIQTVEPVKGNKDRAELRLNCGRRLTIKKSPTMVSLILGL